MEVGKLLRSCKDQMANKTPPIVVLLCDTTNISAVAAMHLVACGLAEITEALKETIHIIPCTVVTDSEMQELVFSGANVGVILSPGVLSTRLVLRMSVLVADNPGNRAVLAIFCPKLEFQFPTDKDYDELKLFAAHELTAGPDVEQSGATPELTRSVSFWAKLGYFNEPRPWSEYHLRFGGANELAAAAVATYRKIFKLIALPLDTHGSWRSMEGQLRIIYERVCEPAITAAAGGLRRHQAMKLSSAEHKTRSDMKPSVVREEESAAMKIDSSDEGSVSSSVVSDTFAETGGSPGPCKTVHSPGTGGSVDDAAHAPLTIRGITSGESSRSDGARG